MVTAAFVRDFQALGGIGRRHPDVGEYHIGLVYADGGQRGVQVVAGREHSDLGHSIQEPQGALPDQEVVLGQHDGNGHLRPSAGVSADAFSVKSGIRQVIVRVPSTESATNVPSNAAARSAPICIGVPRGESSLTTLRTSAAASAVSSIDSAAGAPSGAASTAATAQK